MTTQLENILAALRQADGEFVSALTLHEVSGSLCVHSRIADLRKQGFTIENRTWHESGRTVSQYRLVESPLPSLPVKERASSPVTLAQPELLETGRRIWPD